MEDGELCSVGWGGGQPGAGRRGAGAAGRSAVGVGPDPAMLQDVAPGDASAVSRLAGKVASALVQEGAHWPALAAACLAARGIAGDFEQGEWAGRLSLALPVVEAAEAGALSPRDLPGRCSRWPIRPGPGGGHGRRARGYSLGRHRERHPPSCSCSNLGGVG